MRTRVAIMSSLASLLITSSGLAGEIGTQMRKTLEQGGNESMAALAAGERQRLLDNPEERVSVLENGLTVILKAHRTAPVVSVRMYCKTGSIYEQEYLGAGISHLFEHLLHGGATTNRSEAESREILDAIGGNTNAYTSLGLTAYFINTGKEHLSQAIELLGDWITHPTFPDGAFEREWGVVQRELERDVDNPDRQMFYLTMSTMYREHPARFPIIGYQPIVQSLTKEDIVNYYHRMYVPDNIVVSIAGDIDLDETMRYVQEEFANFERRKVPTIVLPEEPEMTTPRSAIKRMNVQAAMMQLVWPSIELTHPDLYALDVLSYILTQGNSSRLVRTIRDKGLVFSINSFSWTPNWGRGIFVLASRLAPDRIDAAKQGILEQVAELRESLVSEEELEQAKKQKASEHVFSMQTADSVAESMARDFITTGDMHFSEAYVENIQKVTPEQIRAVARKYLSPERLATVMIVPEAYELPSEMTDKAATVEPVRTLTLDNGLRVLIRQDTTSPLVAMQCFSLGGVAYETEQTNGLSHLVGLLAPRGTENRSAQEIARFFDSRGGKIAGASGNNSVYFRAEVLSEDFDEALEVFADVVVNPTFPEAELEIYRPRVLDQIARVDEMWRSELMAYFRKKFFEQSPYSMLTIGSKDVVANVTREDVSGFHAEHVTAPNSVLAVYGDIDPTKAEALVQRFFSAMPSEKPQMPTTAEPSFEQPRLYIKGKSPERRTAGIAVGFVGMEVDNTDDRRDMAVLDTIMSGYRYPTGWLHESLRGGDADYVYEVHAINLPGLTPGFFQVYAACQPEKVNEVYGIITEQLDKARRGEFTKEELDRAKTIIETTETMGRQTNSQRAMDAAIDVLYGLGHDYHDEYIEQVKSVTLDDVHEIAKKYFTTPVVVVVTPDPDAVDIGIEPTVVEGEK